MLGVRGFRGRLIREAGRIAQDARPMKVTAENAGVASTAMVGTVIMLGVLIYGGAAVLVGLLFWTLFNAPVV